MGSGVSLGAKGGESFCNANYASKLTSKLNDLSPQHHSFKTPVSLNPSSTKRSPRELFCAPLSVSSGAPKGACDSVRYVYPRSPGSPPTIPGHASRYLGSACLRGEATAFPAASHRCVFSTYRWLGPPEGGHRSYNKIGCSKTRPGANAPQVPFLVGL